MNKISITSGQKIQRIPEQVKYKIKGKPHNFWKIGLSSYLKNLASSNESGQRSNQENKPENLTNLVQDIDSILNRYFDLHDYPLLQPLRDGKYSEGFQKFLGGVKNLGGDPKSSEGFLKIRGEGAFK